MHVVIQHQDFDIGEEYQRIRTANTKAGAIVFFVGLVRDFVEAGSSHVESNAGAQTIASVEGLELEHYAGMTENLCQAIVDRAIHRFGVSDARIVHRVGKLGSQEQIVFVAAAGQHRAETFQAAEFIMDYLKSEATIWKKEIGDGERTWLGVKDKDALAIARWELEK